MAVLRLLRKPIFAVGLLIVQVYRSAHRKDLPSLSNQDPTGVFGDPDNPKLRVVVLGDSSVTSPGVEPLDASWPRQIANRLAQDFHVELLSVAVGGSKTRDVIADQLDKAIAFGADTAFVSVGANDALRATPLRRFEREYRLIIERLQASVGSVAASGIGDLGSIPRLPAMARSLIRIRGRSFDKAIRRITADNPSIVKTNTWSEGWEEFLTNPDDVFAGDLFHASAYGHNIYTRAAIPAVEALLEQRNGSARSPAEPEHRTGRPESST